MVDMVEWSGGETVQELGRRARDRAGWRRKVIEWVHPRPDPG